jgi:membrane associated rhomboid family serine protease
MVMPLWDDNPLKLPKWPVVTWGLIIANIAVFILQVATPQYNYLVASFAITPANITGVPIMKPPILP